MDIYGNIFNVSVISNKLILSFFPSFNFLCTGTWIISKRINVWRRTWKTNTNNGINIGRLVDSDNENWFHPPPSALVFLRLGLVRGSYLSVDVSWDTAQTGRHASFLLERTADDNSSGSCSTIFHSRLDFPCYFNRYLIIIRIQFGISPITHYLRFYIIHILVLQEEENFTVDD